MKLELYLDFTSYDLTIREGQYELILCYRFVEKLLGSLPEKIILTLSTSREDGFIEARRIFYDVVRTGGRSNGLFSGAAGRLAEFLGNEDSEMMFYFKIEPA